MTSIENDDFYPMFVLYAKKYGVEAAAARCSSLASPSQLAAMTQRFEEQLKSVKSGGAAILRSGGEAWYPGPPADAIYWNPLRDEFRRNTPAHIVESVNEASNNVVAHTPDPNGAQIKGKGLVVGYVQSGKTTNFISVIAKMADEDYGLVIVLTGIHNGLRKQTQQRLSRQLHAPNPKAWHLLTDEETDFRAPTSPPVTILKPNQVGLAVVKKNARVLDRLIKWLNTTSGRNTLANTRVLVIDDEADQATVATSAINPRIRKLLTLAPKHTYIGYTATPFANVFIDPNDYDDLYPRSFILNLPRPDGYFGPEAIFGNDLPEEDPDSSDGYDMVRIVPATDIPKLRPATRQAASTFVPQITLELRQSILWFWLATSARHARGDHAAHSTMLIHTAIPTAVHEKFREPIECLRTEIVHGLLTHDAEVEDEFRNLWESETKRVCSDDFGRQQNTFDEVRSHLKHVVQQTQIIIDNFKSNDRLHYEDDKPTVAIAIGANTLSRGLTLEGLVVSFFVRSANTYDTLMQMGRWFGYRNGYEDLPRIWMTEELRRNFQHLVTVEREMRDDIEAYARLDLTPEEAAVRIRTHPSMRITAKMGAASPAYVSFAGRRLYTRYFRTDDLSWLEGNFAAADELLSNIADTPAEENGRATIHFGISWQQIVSFLRKYSVHSASPDLDADLMMEYIADHADRDQAPTLQRWNVAVVQGGGDRPDLAPVRLGGRDWHPVIRSRLNTPNDRADIKNVMNKGDRGLDLGLSTARLDKLTEPELVSLRNTSKVHSNDGLLVIYPIDPTSEPQTSRSKLVRKPLDAVAPVIGIGIVFPGVPDERGVKAQKMSVDLSDVIAEDLSIIEDDWETAPGEDAPRA